MKKLLKKSKWVYFSLGIVSALMIISALFFMNQYRFVRINYNENDNGEIVYSENAKLNGASQSNLYSFLTSVAKHEYANYKNDSGVSEADEYISNNEYIQIILEEDSNGKKDSNGHSYKYLYLDTGGNAWSSAAKYRFSNDVLDGVVDFRNSLDTFNDLILYFGIVSLISFAILLIFSNHNRKIYYKSNLIAGVVFPVINAALCILLIGLALGLMSKIADPVNNAVYNVLSALQNAKVATGNINVTLNDATNLQYLQNITSAFNVNIATFIGYIIFFGVIAVYNVFLMIFAILKYKDTAKERNDTLEKARMVGEAA